MSNVPRKLLVALAALVVVAVVAAAVVLTRGSDDGDDTADRQREALEAFAAGFESGDFADAPVQGATPAEAAAELERVTEGLAGLESVEVTPAAVVPDEQDESLATSSLAVEWRFAGGTTWSTTSEVQVVLADDGETWAVQWIPSVIHPDLVGGDRFVTETTRATRGTILDITGAPLVLDRPVVQVGVQPSRAQDVDGLATTLAGLLDIDGPELAGRIRAAAPDAFVDVITLRKDDYLPLRAQLQPLPGTVFKETTRALGPTRTFARALLGSAGPVTAEMIEKSDGRYQAGDVAGLSGLQARYDERLAGADGYRIRIEATVPEGQEAPPGKEVFSSEPVPGQSVQVTLDQRVQTAAEDALAGEQRNSALVAIRPSTGEVLAVANGPEGGSANLALEGRYPPGSAFKVVSTLAYLKGGVQPDQTVDCPATATVDGRSFKNAEDEVFGPIPFRQAFAHSCNTVFVGLSDQLEPTTLTETAKQFGLGREWDLGVDAFPGSVPENDSEVDKAASAFGQGRLLTSPFDLAMVAATVADGNWRTPVLVRDPLPDGADAPPEPLPEGTPDVLRALMREVVTDGTGDAVAGVPGGEVHGKTGTAEFGTEVPPRSHAWFIGFQGDLAFACFVEGGEFGGDTAAPIVADFLTRLAGG
jgi:cell division protein FtsI/penicillin-binding protein 2